MSNGGVLGRRNVPGVDGLGGVWSLREVADASRLGLWGWDGVDLFDTDTTAQYTQSADANATWSIANGELTASGGTQALFIRNGVSLTDAVVEVDITAAQNAGLILRFINNSNYYLMDMSDDSGAIASVNANIYKRVGGTFTQLATAANQTWPRGSLRKVRFSVVGTTLTGYLNGEQIVQATDSAHAGPGGVGLRNTTSGIAVFQTFRWRHL